MVPLDVVRQVTDVDTAVLLGRVANGVQHLLFGDGALLKRFHWTLCTSVSRTSAWTYSSSVHWCARPAVVLAIVVAASRAAAWGIRASARGATWAAGATTARGSGSLTLRTVSTMLDHQAYRAIVLSIRLENS